jgi:hypothetical protein
LLSRQRIVSELEQEKQMRKDMENKHNKEIDNLKLMHSQELYIMRKKDKKLAN